MAARPTRTRSTTRSSNFLHGACGTAGVSGAVGPDSSGRAAWCARGRRPAREARRPHFVRRCASKPARALRTLRRPSHQWGWGADVWFGASSRSPARPRNGPRALEISRVKPLSPLLARLCVGLKPPSPLLAQAEPQLKPTSPLRAKRSCFLCIFRLQWCCRFQWSLFGGEQWRRRFHVGLHPRSQR